MRYLSTTIKGLEDVAMEELRSMGAREFKIMDGKIIYNGNDDFFYRANYLAKTINRVVILFVEEKFSDLKDIKRIVSNSDMCITGTFGVETERHGKHDFTSIDVNATIGEAILQKCPDAKVNLDDPDNRVLALVLDDLFLMGFDTTGISLHRRGYRLKKHPTALNPVIAASMIRISGWRKGTLVDPFCGSGTIPIEAYHAYKSIPNMWRDFAFKRFSFFDEDTWEKIRRGVKTRRGEPDVYGFDSNEKYLQNATVNASRAKANVTCEKGKAEELHKSIRDVNYIVTDPPYGLRMGNRKKIFKLYEDFAKELEENFSGVTMVVITPHKKFEYYFDVLEIKNILYGELRAKIYKLKI